MSWWLGRFIESRLVGVTRVDPIALGGATLVIVVTFLVASAPSAGRAARLDPASVLRT